MLENLAHTINKIYPLSETSLLLLMNEMKFQEHTKDEIFVKIGRKNDLEYVLLDGICRSFAIDPEGNEITLSFYISGIPISPNITRVDNKGLSFVNIQALSTIEIVSFSSSKLMELMRINREISDWGNKVLQNELFQKVEKEMAQASMTAKERLHNFRKKYAVLENLIPHSYIASYLGITNVSLSRLRSITSKK